MEGDLARKRADVNAVADEESDAIVAGDLERLFAVLSTDCVMMPPNLMTKTGDELRQWFREFLDSVTVESLYYEHGRTMIAGDLACHDYVCGWKVTPKSGEPATTPHFKGLHILQRASDGSWKICREIWNLNPARAATQ